jgi:hypothetical protein
MEIWKALTAVKRPIDQNTGHFLGAKCADLRAASRVELFDNECRVVGYLTRRDGGAKG